jgi:hypothetical protein
MPAPSHVHVISEDFEYRGADGDNPEVVCYVARNLTTGEYARWWADEIHRRKAPPFPQTADFLYLSYMGTAEQRCRHALGWEAPVHFIDMHGEFCNAVNGLKESDDKSNPLKAGLIDAAKYLGIPAMESSRKAAMRERILRGPPWSSADVAKILDYCQEDVDVQAQLWVAMQPWFSDPKWCAQALLRGRYIENLSYVEDWGVPLNVDLLDAIKVCIPEIKESLFAKLDPGFNVFDDQGSLRQALFEAMLKRHGYEWPRHRDGRLDLRDSTFKDMIFRYPTLNLVRDIRRVSKHLQLDQLQVGRDGRNRALLTAFTTRTGRNAPSGNKYVFGLPGWLRRLIVPRPATALLYVDVSSQEFGLGAYLSGDPQMIASYESGDPYIYFAKLAKAVPDWATAKTHPQERALYKQCCLAVGYGMGAKSLALRIGLPVQYAVALIRQHKQLYQQYWAWTHAAIARARFFGELQTVFGWTLHATGRTKDRTIRNFPLQANASEQLRLAVIYAVENGVRVVGTLHDALLVECPTSDVEAVAHQTQAALAMAAEDVLGGPTLRSDVQVIRPPNHFAGEVPNETWNIVCEVLKTRGYTDTGQKVR